MGGKSVKIADHFPKVSLSSSLTFESFFSLRLETELLIKQKCGLYYYVTEVLKSTSTKYF